MSHFADHSDPDADDFAQAESDRDAARREVARLREALAAVVKACRNCGGSGIAVRRYNFPDLVCGADGCKIARAALVAGKREGGG